MSKFSDCIENYKSQSSHLGLDLSEALLTKIAKGLGPSIYNSDSSKVSAGDSGELERLKSNFLIKKLGLPDSPDLDAGIAEVLQTMGTSNRNKYRAVVYALLVRRFAKEDMFL